MCLSVRYILLQNEFLDRKTIMHPPHSAKLVDYSCSNTFLSTFVYDSLINSCPSAVRWEKSVKYECRFRRLYLEIRVRYRSRRLLISHTLSPLTGERACRSQLSIKFQIWGSVPSRFVLSRRLGWLDTFWKEATTIF